MSECVEHVVSSRSVLGFRARRVLYNAVQCNAMHFRVRHSRLADHTGLGYDATVWCGVVRWSVF